MKAIFSDFQELQQYIRPTLDEKTLERIGISMRKSLIKQTKAYLEQDIETDVVLIYTLLQSDSSLYKPETDKNKIIHYAIQCDPKEYKFFNTFTDGTKSIISIHIEHFLEIAKETYGVNKKREREEEQEQYEEEDIFEVEEEKKENTIQYRNSVEEFVTTKCSINKKKHATQIIDYRVFYLLYVYWMMKQKRLDCLTLNQCLTVLYKHFKEVLHEKIYMESRRQHVQIFIHHISIDIPDIPAFHFNDYYEVCI